MLKINKNLTNINLWGNNIGAEGAKHIADMLKINTTLTNINLGYNNINKTLIDQINNELEIIKHYKQNLLIFKEEIFNLNLYFTKSFLPNPVIYQFNNFINSLDLKQYLTKN